MEQAELLQKLELLKQEYQKKAKIVIPLIQRLNDIENEIKIITEELVKRGTLGADGR